MLFYDVIKDFPELTFGAVAIRDAVGRFHVTLDSVLVFKQVGLWSCCRRQVSGSEQGTRACSYGLLGAGRP